MRKPTASSVLLRRKKCKFADQCSLYSTASFTCTHTGGSYCGRYRKFAQKPIDMRSTPDYLEIQQ